MIVRAIKGAPSITIDYRFQEIRLSEYCLAKSVTYAADIIRFSKRPSKKLQEAAISAVRKGMYQDLAVVFRSIPDTDLKLEYLKLEPEHLRFVSNEDEVLCLAAVQFDPNWISDINAPTESVQLEAIYSNPDVIEDIRGWTEEYDEDYDAMVDVGVPAMSTFVYELNQFITGSTFDFTKWPDVQRAAVISSSVGARGPEQVRALIDTYRKPVEEVDVPESVSVSSEDADMLLQETNLA